MAGVSKKKFHVNWIQIKKNEPCRLMHTFRYSTRSHRDEFTSIRLVEYQICACLSRVISLTTLLAAESVSMKSVDWTSLILAMQLTCCKLGTYTNRKRMLMLKSRSSHLTSILHQIKSNPIYTAALTYTTSTNVNYKLLYLLSMRLNLLSFFSSYHLCYDFPLWQAMIQ